jgi:hypothetical protein
VKDVVFAKEKEAKVATITEAIDFVKDDLKHYPVFESLGNLSIDDNYHLHMNGTELVPTTWGFDGFLKQLGIPTRFGRKIPKDLLEVVVNRLKALEDKRVQLITRDGDGEGTFTLVNVVGASYDPIPLVPFMEEMNLGNENAFVRVGDRGFLWGVQDKTAQAEPKVGDIVKFGIYVKGSESGGVYPQARLMAYRLQCTNGVTVGDDFGFERWRRRGDDRDNFETFKGKIQGLLDKCHILHDGVMNLDRDMTAGEFRTLWRKTAGVTGKPEADVLFGINEEQRDNYKATGRETPENTIPVNAYNIYNNISAKARDLGYLNSERLMNVAGLMIYNYEAS